eukprot:TRINITY_DN5519_c0_g2_i1.p1 TRINITY_DN5519_c0_g2~~TRINITY_DN5519_c0_g2_i1.p1  ORF type:complete len:637 (+),score=139.23 TRINITY_DN5519_c0_g2_i1:186-2096(+)
MSSATVRVEKATSDLLIGPDWTMNMDICDSINTNHWQAKDVVKAVKKRLQHKNPKVQLLALTLLETMIKNCGDYVHLQVAERNILQEMIKIVRKKVDMNVRDKILVLLDSWQEAFGGPRGKYPQYYWAYDELKRSGVEFPKRSVDAAPIFTPPVTHPTARHSLAGYGMPSNSTRTLDEAMASEMESLSLSNLDSIRSIMELLNEMLQAVNSNDREALKDEVIMDLASRCRSNQKKLVQLLNSTGDEELLGQGLALNDSLQTLLAKHDAIASGSPLPTEAISSNATSAPGTSSPPSKVIDSSSKVTAPETQVAVTTHQVDEEDEEDDDFAQLARRRSRTSTMPSQSTSTETTTTGAATPCNALALPDPPAAVRTTTKEQDMIDLLSITLCTNSTSPHSPLTPPTTYSTSTPPPSSSNQGGHQVPISPSAQGSPYGPQQYPGHQGQTAFDSYVVPWAQPQPQTQPQTQPPPQTQLPQYSSSYPPPPWAAPTNSPYSQPSSIPFPYQTSQASLPGSYMPMHAARSLQQYNSFGSRGNNGPSAYGEAQASSGPRHVGPRPLQHYHSFNSRPNNAPSTFGEAQASFNARNVSPAGNKPYVPTYRLFEDLVDLRSADGGVKTSGTPASLSGTSSHGMVGGRK